jgi:hypothetical protein
VQYCRPIRGRKSGMTAHTVSQPKRGRKSRGLLVPLGFTVVLVAAAGSFVSYVLWPTWPTIPVALDVPAIPVTVAGVLFNVPPAAIRAAVQRHPGAHERIDLVFLWPSLEPPAEGEGAATRVVNAENNALPAGHTDDRVFMTIAALGGVFTPVERLRTIYPRYFAAEATAGPGGLGVLAFRAGTPYDGEDLVYFADRPERFFARCTRALRALPGTCIHEGVFDAAQITMRFPRLWLEDWRNIAAGFDRLTAKLHPPG